MSLLEDFFTPEQLAGELAIHVRTLRKLDERGEGPPKTPVGRKILYRKESVVAWLKSREQRRQGRKSR